MLAKVDQYGMAMPPGLFRRIDRCCFSEWIKTKHSVLLGPVPAGNEWKCKKENKKEGLKKRMNDNNSSSYSKEEREIIHKPGLPIYKGTKQRSDSTAMP